MSRPFHFRQFTIHQEHSPMKVGTDGVLLGAWCSLPAQPQILDIGTGTGLIAIMLAQRSPEAHVAAIEPNADAYRDAAVNVSASPFRERISLHEQSIASFVPPVEFDLIISNPPFYANSLPAKNTGRTLARHQHSFQPAHLAEASAWLNANGILAGIYPPDVFDIFEELASKHGLFLLRKTMVYPNPLKLAHRVLFEFSLANVAPEITAPLVIETGDRHEYSPEYKALTSAFYLNF